LGIGAFIIFSKIDFEVLSLFSTHLYIFSILFLTLPLIIGEVTRGTVRWIQIGSFTLQPSELVKPFLLLFFSNLIINSKLGPKEIVKNSLLAILPAFLIFIQPSLGVTILLLVSYFGVILASRIDKKRLIFILSIIAISLPLFWIFLAPYQKERVTSFVKGGHDPLGAGYNAIQSVITVGSGKLWGKGPGRGVQTQLYFLPERHTDFVFASISEELGFIGAFFVLLSLFLLISRLILIMENSVNPVARAFIMGTLLVLGFQIFINIGMNMGIVPITGLPLPLVSAGGSAFLATMMSLGISVSAKNKSHA